MSIGKLVLGTVQFGLDYGINNTKGKPSFDQALSLLTRASENGIRILDTADGYGNAQEIIGRFHQENNYRFHVNTKFKGGDNINVAHQVSHSLEQLKIDFINVYFYHHFNDMMQFPSLGNDLLKIKSTGKIKKIGVSIYDNQQFETAILSEHIDVIQLPFNLLDNSSQRAELIAEAKKRNKEIQVRSVFLQGLFFKSLESYPDRLLPLKKYIQQLQDILSETSLSMAQLAMAYVFSNKNIDNVIMGIDTEQQLYENINYSEVVIPDNIIEKIDRIIVTNSELLYPFNWN